MILGSAVAEHLKNVWACQPPRSRCSPWLFLDAADDSDQEEAKQLMQVGYAI